MPLRPARYSIWIAALAVIIGTLVVHGLTGNWAASAACALTGIVPLALLINALRQREDASTPPMADLHDDPAEPDDDDQLTPLLQAVPNPLIIVRDGQIEHCNTAAMALLGQHIAGQDVRLAIRHPAVVDMLNAPQSSATIPTRLDVVGIGTPGQSWELLIEPLPGARQLVLFLDQSAKQATERMRVDFVANASHELRTPLAGIVGFIETLREPEAGNDAAIRERFLSVMDGEARRMQELVDDLMSLSRIEADKFRAPDQPVAIDQLARDVVDVLRNSRGERADDIVLDLASDTPAVRGDSAQLSQLLHNLISNALKYGTPGTPVRIATRRRPRNMVELTIIDHGEGISPEHLPRLTERFYRIDPGRSRAGGGTGLGLAIVKHIVQRHRGLLRFESTLGEGTTARVELPIHAPDADKDAEPHEGA